MFKSSCIALFLVISAVVGLKCAGYTLFKQNKSGCTVITEELRIDERTTKEEKDLRNVTRIERSLKIEGIQGSDLQFMHFLKEIENSNSWFPTLPHNFVHFAKPLFLFSKLRSSKSSGPVVAFEGNGHALKNQILYKHLEGVSNTENGTYVATSSNPVEISSTPSEQAVQQDHFLRDSIIISVCLTLSILLLSAGPAFLGHWLFTREAKKMSKKGKRRVRIKRCRKSRTKKTSKLEYAPMKKTTVSKKSTEVQEGKGKTSTSTISKVATSKNTKSKEEMNSNTKIMSMAFNPQQDCFTFGCDDGVRVFNSNPPVLMRSLNRDLVGSVRLCTILHRSNLIVFVGAGTAAKFPSNVVFVWDDKRQELILEITVKGGPIVNLLVEHTRLIVVQERKIHIFSFPSPCRLIRTEDIKQNPTGLVAMSGDKDCQMLVYPGFKIGSIQLMNLKALTEGSSLAPSTIDAHLTEIVQLTINIDGTLVATGSSQGTVIRVFNTRTHGILMECRRGADPSTLHCLQFSPCSSYLAVSSDKGTIHVFAIRESDESASRRSLLQQVGIIKERRSCAQIPVEQKVLSCGFIKGPHSQQSLIALCTDGSYHKFSFDHEGHAHREGFDNVIQLSEEQEFWTRPT